MKRRYYLVYQRGRTNLRTMPKFRTDRDAFLAFSEEDMFAGTHLVDIKQIHLTKWELLAIRLFEKVEYPWLGFGWLRLIQPRLAKFVFGGVPLEDYEIRERGEDLPEINVAEYGKEVGE